MKSNKNHNKNKKDSRSKYSLERFLCEIIGFTAFAKQTTPISLLSSLPLLFQEVWLNYVHVPKRPIAYEVISFENNIGVQLELRETLRIHSLSDKRIVKISCGNFHSLAISEFGLAFGWGNNDFGQLGIGTKTQPIRLPSLITSLKGKRVIDIACGDHHSLFLLETHNVLSCGNGAQGQLGSLKENPEYLIPTQVPRLTKKIAQIACGNSHNFAVFESNIVVGWGRNDFGQLGVGDGAKRWLPTIIHSLDNKHIVSLFGGNAHSLVLTSSGSVLFTGNKNFLFGEDDVDYKFKAISGLKGAHIISIASNSDCCFAVSFIGEVFVWGRNNFGQLGLGHRSDLEFIPCEIKSLYFQNVSKIFCGFVLSSNNVYYWGQEPKPTDEKEQNDGKSEQEENQNDSEKLIPKLVSHLKASEIIDISSSSTTTTILLF